LKDLDKDEDFSLARPNDQNEYTREDHDVWQEGDADQKLLVALYRGHPQLDPPLPNDDYKNPIVNGAKHWKLPTDYIRQLEFHPHRGLSPATSQRLSSLTCGAPSCPVVASAKMEASRESGSLSPI